MIVTNVVQAKKIGRAHAQAIQEEHERRWREYEAGGDRRRAIVRKHPGMPFMERAQVSQ